MPPRAWRVRINDALEAVQRVLVYVEGVTFQQFAADPKTIDAVSYAIIVVGEAASNVPDFIAREAPTVPWADIRGMRNRITHEYFGIDVGVLWATVVEDLPRLRGEFRALLARNDLP